MRWPRLILAWAAIACSPPRPLAEPSPTSTEPPLASAAPAPTSSTSAAPLLELPEAVLAAYDSRSVDAFRPIVRQLLRRGARRAEGLGDIRAVVIEGHVAPTSGRGDRTRARAISFETMATDVDGALEEVEDPLLLGLDEVHQRRLHDPQEALVAGVELLDNFGAHPRAG